MAILQAQSVLEFQATIQMPATHSSPVFTCFLFSPSLEDIREGLTDGFNKRDQCTSYGRIQQEISVYLLWKGNDFWMLKSSSCKTSDTRTDQQRRCTVQLHCISVHCLHDQNIPFTCVAFTEFIIFSKKPIPVVTRNFFSRFNIAQSFHTCCIPAS